MARDQHETIHLPSLQAESGSVSANAEPTKMAKDQTPAPDATPIVDRLKKSARTPMGAFGLAVITFFIVLAILAPVLAPYDPLRHAPDRLAPPSTKHLFGTDEFGRDVLSRIIHGTRPALLIGVLTVLLASLLALPLGLLAGYKGGAIDTIVMRIADGILSFPVIILGIALIAVVGPGTLSTAVVIGVASTPVLARVTRAIALTEREKDYVAAAQMLGATTGRIIWRHLLPNSVGPLLVYATTTMSAAVLADAAFSFLGLGTQPPTPSWGQMLNSGKAYLFQDFWLGLFPGMAVALLVLGLTYLADGLVRGFDVRT